MLEHNNEFTRDGAYFTVNGFANFVEGSYTGRTKNNVTSFNGNFLDIDLTPETKRTQAELIYTELCEKGLQPTAVVLTGKGLHVYWLYSEPQDFSIKKLSEYEVLQSAIVERYKSQGADNQARDAARVLRIPGANYYNKAGEWMGTIELLYLNPESKYTPLEIAKYFNSTIKIDTPEGKNLVEQNSSTDFDISTLFHVKKGTRHHDAYSAALSVLQFGKSVSAARRWFEAILKTWESPSNDPLNWFDAWNQFEAAKKKIEEENPQFFIGDPEALNTTIMSFENIEEEKLEWLWEGFIAKGKSHMLTGDPGFGKSQITIDIAARLSTGAPFPSVTLGEKKRPPVGVIILSAEDDPGDTIKPRLRAAGADLNYVLSLAPTIIERAKGNKTTVRSLSLREDAEQILKAIATLPVPIGLVIIDPISAFLNSKQDSNSNSDARGILAQLQNTIMSKGISLLMINHNNKNTAASGAHMRSMGSVGWNAAARATFYVFKDKEDEKNERKIFSVGKMNLAENKHPGFFYYIKSKYIPIKGEETIVPYIEWVTTQFPTKNADELSNESGQREERRTIVDECKDEIELFMLTHPLDEVPSKDGLKYMKEKGFAQAQIYRAAEKLGLNQKHGYWTKKK